MLLWAKIETESSEKLIYKLEAKLAKGNLTETQALRLLRIYHNRNRYKDAQKALDQIMVNNLRTKEILKFSVQHYLYLRDYNNAYRLSKDLCYHYDRYGDSLLHLSKIAILVSDYGLATTWLQEYIEHNPTKIDHASYWLGLSYLRQRYFSKALICFNNRNGNLIETDSVRWLSAIDKGKLKPLNKNWFGSKTTPMKRLHTLNWKSYIINSSLEFQASSLTQIDEWINQKTYISDDRLYEEADRWQIPSEFEKIGQGDCEDFALWAWVQLLRMNRNARFMLGGLFSEELNHAWVCIYGRDGVKVFECTPSEYNVLIAAKNVPEYLPILSVDKSLNWYCHQ